MSAPESSNSKAPPSLLSDKAKGADTNGSRILANLEGRVAPPTEKPRRSKAPLLLGALLVIAAGGWGAWHMQQRQQDDTLAAATSASAEAEKPAAPAVSAVSAASATAATAAVPASSSNAAAQLAAAKTSAASATSAAAASSPAPSQAATIIADDSDSKSAAASATTPASGDGSRLSRALADGAEPSSAPTPVAAATSASAVQVPAAKHGKNATAVASNGKHDAAHGKKESTTASAGNHHASAPTAVAQTKKSRPAGAASKDDSDADLLAALVARTKPADPKAGSATTKVSATAPGSAKLAERVKECSQRGFFEDQLCRWRVCDGHWGKDPACPGAAPQARQP